MPSDPFYPSQWSLPKISWDKVYDSFLMTQGTVTVAVLDTGIDAIHPDLSGVVIPGTSILDGSNGITDSNGHGTWMAGIIAAVPNGMGIVGVGYPGVNIMPVTVLGADGTGQDSDIIAGVMYAVDHGANIILMGFSNHGFSQSLQDAIDYAWSKPLPVIVTVVPPRVYPVFGEMLVTPNAAATYGPTNGPPPGAPAGSIGSMLVSESARAMFTRPLPVCSVEPAGSAVRARRPTITPFVNPGSTAFINAATPATIAEDADVPLMEV